MSGSFKKHPIGGNTTSRSEKLWKRLCNRKLRRAISEAMLRFDDECTVIPVVDEVVNQWDGPKDGKRYYDKGEVGRHPKLIRK